MRIISGKYRGRNLSVPSGGCTRPSTGFLREAIFSMLGSLRADAPCGMRVLDLFAGSGALGFEALSRGAVRVCFIDMAVAARACLYANAEHLDVFGDVSIYRRDATRLGKYRPNPDEKAHENSGGYDLIFMDPPYGKGLVVPVLSVLFGGGWVAPRGLMIIEEAAHVVIDLPPGCERLQHRVHDDSAVTILRYRG